jgi:hypothetical protein
MNIWLQQKLSSNFSNMVSFYPQHKYIFDDEKRQQVDHVLLYNDLEKQFPHLMKLYNLSEIDISKRVNAPTGLLSTTVKLTVHNLTSVTRNMIYNYAREDFDMIANLPIYKDNT